MHRGIHLAITEEFVMSVPKNLIFVMFIHDTTIHGGKIALIAIFIDKAGKLLARKAFLIARTCGPIRVCSPRSKKLFDVQFLDQPWDTNLYDIPPNVVRDYGDRFSNPVTLEVPTGNEWQVSLLKRGNNIQLVGGWKQFVDFYHLEPGCSVVFKHDGGNHNRFLVSMFGCNGMRIDHPQRGTMKKGSCSRSNQEQAEEGDGSSSSIKKKPRLRLDICTEGMFIKGYKPKGRATPDLISSRALKASVDFTSRYPFFKIVLELMDIQRNNLDIPYNFVKKLPDKKKTDATLEIGSRSWKVILSKFSSNKTGRLSTGWLPFVRDNGLRVGDICIFELISERKFCVNLFKGLGGQ